MDEVLKGLQGKSLTKKKLFDFLADINIETLYGMKDTTVHNEIKPDEPVKQDKPVKKDEPVKKEEPNEVKHSEEQKCGACMKSFSTKASMKRHQERFTVCKEWIERPQKTDITKLTKGLHLIIDDILEKSIGEGGLECKFCKARFVTKGNHHKHFNTSNVCNRLAYQEFKKLFNEL